MSVSRRAFVTGGSLALSALWARHLHAFDGVLGRPLIQPDAEARALAAADTPFTLGVASGDPWADSLVIWTRLALDPTRGGGMPPGPVTVNWQVALDDKMSRVVKKGTAVATAEWAHSVHVEVTGLDPDRWYWYQFRTGDHLSPIGRTRTFPRPGAAATKLRFAFASCENYEVGYFNPYKEMAKEDLDLVFFLGDYLYEAAPIKDRPRLHVSPELTTLQDYRDRYAQYRTDPNLQQVHANFPWILTWDDHEVANNYAGLISQKNDPRDIFLARRAAAYHAYYEHMPLRRSSMPHDAYAQMYRSFQYGALASFFVLDTRQYRTDQPCDDGTKPLCEEALNPKATLMGDEQEKWLFNNLDRSRAGWNVIPQQVMLAPFDQGTPEEPRYSMDQWSGYPAARDRVMEFLGRRKPNNPVVLTGDIHSNWVNDLKTNFKDEKAPAVGTELVVTSITSGADGSDISARMKGLLTRNPHVKFQNSQRGYVSCEVTPAGLRADYKVVDKVTTENYTASTRASFRVTSGKPGAEQI
ncbi:MAG: alkaline phosphatase [Acidobacteria bacterium]|nr:MAG: alkaline phosphatase [Acidobacteriota bacterium]